MAKNQFGLSYVFSRLQKSNQRHFWWAILALFLIILPVFIIIAKNNRTKQAGIPEVMVFAPGRCSPDLPTCSVYPSPIPAASCGPLKIQYSYDKKDWQDNLKLGTWATRYYIKAVQASDSKICSGINLDLLPEIYWEAEKSITSPFTISTQDNRQVISQPATITDPTKSGLATYQFTLQGKEAGTYNIKARVNAPDKTHNSFFVNINSNPTTAMVWDIAPTNGYIEKTVSWVSSTTDVDHTAKDFTLKADTPYTIYIRGREAGAYIDSISLVKTTPLCPLSPADGDYLAFRTDSNGIARIDIPKKAAGTYIQKFRPSKTTPAPTAACGDPAIAWSDPAPLDIDSGFPNPNPELVNLKDEYYIFPPGFAWMLLDKSVCNPNNTTQTRIQIESETKICDDKTTIKCSQTSPEPITVWPWRYTKDSQFSYHQPNKGTNLRWLVAKPDYEYPYKGSSLLTNGEKSTFNNYIWGYGDKWYCYKYGGVNSLRDISTDINAFNHGSLYGTATGRVPGYNLAPETVTLPFYDFQTGETHNFFTNEYDWPGSPQKLYQPMSACLNGWGCGTTTANDWKVRIEWDKVTIHNKHFWVDNAPAVRVDYFEGPHPTSAEFSILKESTYFMKNIGYVKLTVKRFNFTTLNNQSSSAAGVTYPKCWKDGDCLNDTMEIPFQELTLNEYFANPKIKTVTASSNTVDKSDGFTLKINEMTRVNPQTGVYDDTLTFPDPAYLPSPDNCSALTGSRDCSYSYTGYLEAQYTDSNGVSVGPKKRLWSENGKVTVKPEDIVALKPDTIYSFRFRPWIPDDIFPGEKRVGSNNIPWSDPVTISIYTPPPKLTGHWNMEVNNGIVKDQSGSHDATVVGSPTSTAGPTNYGTALSFGTGNYIKFDIGDVTNLKLPLSISAWINVSDCTVASNILRTSDKDDYSGVYMYLQKGNVASCPNSGCCLGVGYGDGGTKLAENQRNKQSVNKIQTGGWHHVAAVIKGATDMNLFIDGIEDTSNNYLGSGGSLVSTSSVAVIGKQTAWNLTFLGAIDEVRFYQGALSAVEVKNIYDDTPVVNPPPTPPPPSPTLPPLVSYWDMKVNPDNTVTDLSGGHSGTINGNPTVDAGRLLDNTALRFGNITNYISFNNFSDMAGFNLPVSISAWIKLDTNSCTSNNGGINMPSVIFRSQNVSNLYSGFALYIQRGCKLGANYNDGLGTGSNNLRNKESATDSIRTNDWVKVAASINKYDNSSNYIRLFIDNKEVTGTFGGTGSTMPNGINPAAIGNQQKPSTTFYGAIDEVKFYQGELTQQLIDLYKDNY